MHRSSFILVVLLACANMLYAQTFSSNFKQFKDVPRHYICYQVTGAEPNWESVPWTEDFQDIEGVDKPAPLHRTRVKMLWDAQYLHVLAELEEPHIRATLLQHDTIIFHDNDFEVFIDPDGDTHQYYEIEINALNTVMDLFMTRPYRNGGVAMINWDTKGLRTSVKINGTLNNAADIDKSWTVEMAIPFKALSFYNRRSTPEDGSMWRINFSRVEWQMDIQEGKYIKKPRTPEYNWVWSPQGIINMHAPERWGYLQFSTQSPTVAFREPATTAARNELWDIYYRQQQYRERNRYYAKDKESLNVSSAAVIEATTTQFTATIREAGYVTIINQEGKITSYHE